MAQSGFTPIQLFRTTTAAAVPTAGDLAAGELAINLTDEALYFKNAAGVVKLLADSSGALGTVTSVDVSGGTTGLTTSGGPITSSGTITLAGTLGVANGGTGTATAFTAGSVVFAGASGVYTQDNANFFWDNANDRLGIGTATPGATLDVNGEVRIYPASSPAQMRFGVGGAEKGKLSVDTSSNMAFETAGTERMRITSGGDVGIGTASPGARLDVATASGDCIIRVGNGTSQARFAVDNDGPYIYPLTSGDSSLRVFTPVGSEAMRIDSSGFVGIGTTSPSTKLTVTNGAITAGASGDVLIGRFDNSFPSPGVGYFRLRTNNTDGGNGGISIDTLASGTLVERMRINELGNVMIGTTSSSSAFTVQRASSDSAEIKLNQTGSGGRDYRISSTGTGYGSAGNLIFYDATAGEERMRINASGNVAVGTTTAASTSGKNITIGGIEPSLVLNASSNRSFSIASGGNFQYTPSTLCFIDNTAGATRMVIDSSGNVGIGTNSPARRLTVSAGAGLSVLAIQDVNTGSTATDGFQLQLAGNGDGYLWNYENATMVFGTNDTERMRVSATGNVGIGVASPVQKLDVDGSIVARTGGTVFTDSVAEYSGGGINLTVGTTGARDLVLRTNNTEKARIDTNGNFGLGTATPTTYAVGSDRTLAIAGSSFASLNLVCGGSFSGAGLTVDSSANLQFRNVGVERMRIDNSGNVAIGTTNTGYGRFVAYEASNSILSVANSTSYAAFQQNGADLYINVNQSGAAGGNLVFRRGAAATESARITPTGTLFINSADNALTSALKLSVTAAAGEGTFLFKNDAGNNQWTGWVWNTATTGDNLFINFLTEGSSGTARGSITYNRAGGLVAYNVTSDYRAKDIIGPVTDAGTTIDALKVYNGKMKGATIARPMLVAHEAQEVVPYAVTGEKDAVNADGSDKHQQMDHQSFIPLLIAEIQSLRARVAQLEGN
jgi:hypothetical protein